MRVPDESATTPLLTEDDLRVFATDVEHFRRTGDAHANERVQRMLRTVRGTPDYERLDRIVRRS